MRSSVRLLAGQQLTIAAACTIILNDVDNFATGSSSSVPAAELVIDGVGAAAVLSQAAQSDDHKVKVLVEDE